jgi:hypothetical protein
MSSDIIKLALDLLKNFAILQTMRRGTYEKAWIYPVSGCPFDHHD